MDSGCFRRSDCAAMKVSMTQTRNRPSSCKLAGITWSATFAQTEKTFLKTKASRWNDWVFSCLEALEADATSRHCFDAQSKRNIICVEKAWDASIIQLFSQRVFISHHLAFKVFLSEWNGKPRNSSHFRRINFHRKKNNNWNFLVEN